MTPYELVFESFLDLIIRDTTFFIKNPDKEVVKLISDKRMKKLLKHAITNIMLVKDSKDFEINFVEQQDDENNRFNVSLNSLEIDLIAYFMWQVYIEEEVVVRLRALKTIGFSDDEIKHFSPAESLKQFNASLDRLKEENENRVKSYKRRDRSTLKYKRFDFNFE